MATPKLLSSFEISRVLSTFTLLSTISITSDITGSFGASGGGGGTSVVIGTDSSSTATAVSADRVVSALPLLLHWKAPRTTNKDTTIPISLSSNFLFSRFALVDFLTSICFKLFACFLQSVKLLFYSKKKIALFIFNLHIFLSLQFSCRSF